MAIVPPGNKQVGEFTAVVTTSRPSATYAQLVTGSIVVLNSLVGITPTPVNNLMLGEYSAVVVTSRPTAVYNTLTTGSMVVKYTPPAMGVCSLFTGSMVVAEPNTKTPVPPLNLMFGDYTAIVVTKRNTAVTAQLLTASMVVQQYTRRVEALIMSLTYPTVK